MMSITIQSIQSFFNTWAPSELAASWDNVGLQIGHKLNSVQTVLVALEVTLPVLTYLESNRFDLVVTHHPLFFKPLKSVDTKSDVGRILSLFLSKSMNLYTMHTNLDATVGGVNDELVKVFGFHPAQGERLTDGIGLLFDSCSYLPDQLSSVMSGRWVGAELPSTISKIAFCGGSGRSLLPQLAGSEVDVFVTGELSYHDEVFCEYHGISAYLIGHHESEVVILPEIQSRLVQSFPGLSVKIFGEDV